MIISDAKFIRDRRALGKKFYEDCCNPMFLASTY